ncbi:hypothetical protein PIB30_093291 [Stylosanthes scabra]|uniref:Uncharacterized protein n=1 Tax=Stylosanthes scabra TaxID=79078 RepID=A0ABU6QWG8_9FABA|nr:hypothetical protein [Stylosanthes scabra]
MSEDNVEEEQHDPNPNAQRFYELLDMHLSKCRGWLERWPQSKSENNYSPQTDAPGTGPGTGSPDADDDPDYV